ncbi:MAG: hypothetical protein C4547_07015 [Phycisphaerales bacterium]|nr:MAG: hypothetical protein C4547_07015 [Phycisphaerales bacterium]
MIEFKAECGHTVRARDEDAGKKVKCSYCGQDTPVPGQNPDDLDFLFHEVEEASASAAPPRRRRGRRAAPFAKLPRGDDSPMGLAMKFVYAAALLGVIFIVSKELIVPYFTAPAKRSARGSGAEGGEPEAPQRPQRPAPGNPHGLIGLETGRGGLYLASFPPNASAYYVAAQAVDKSGRVADVRGCQRVQTDAQVAVPEDVYVVEVAFPWNSPNLTHYEGYSEFRRQLENAPAASSRAGDGRKCRDDLAGEYFLKDGADRVMVAETDDQLYVVRQFQNVRVRQDRWTAVRVLFIPADITAQALTAKVAQIPTQYSFDEDYVRGELQYYAVPAADRMHVLDLLKRIGVMPYRTKDPLTNVTRTRLFKIGLEDGMFAAPVIEEGDGG